MTIKTCKMKPLNLYKNGSIRLTFFILLPMLWNGLAQAQDSTTAKTESSETAAVQIPKPKPVKNTFESIWLIDNQTVMVPVKKTFEIDIMHRFGTIKNGYKDFFGFFAPSNIRLGFSYVPVKNTLIGVSITKANMTWEGYLKYALLKQTKGVYPISITYFADAAYDTRSADNFIYNTDRWSFFHQIIIGRKVTNKLSVQVAPSVSHINIVNGYWADSGKIGTEMKHDHFAVAVSGRYMVKRGMSIIANYDQPLTKHATNNPNPNISFGLEMTTGSHQFQFFLGNYSFITPQRNAFYNHNDYTKGQFLIGFNITRLWNY